ncbi:MAG: UDP-N-acetylglucosamine--LPS N-acetylglucosamine transferase [Myxococcota bacterium]
MRILCVASSGGHLALLMSLVADWPADVQWVTFDTPDARSRLRGQDVIWAHHPTQRNPLNAARNLLLARRVMAADPPDAVVSNGAGVAVPFLLWARWREVTTVFVEVPDRIQHPSLTGRLVAQWVDAVVLSAPEQAAFYEDGVFFGRLS